MCLEALRGQYPGQCSSDPRLQDFLGLGPSTLVKRVLIAALVARDKELNHPLGANSIFAELRRQREPSAADIFSVLSFPCFVGHDIIRVDALEDDSTKKTIRKLLAALLQFTKLSVCILSHSYD